MKTKFFSILFVCPVYASYTYEVYTYGESKTLHDEETILMDLQGGMDSLTLFDESSADIKGTSLLGDGTGGVWFLHLSNSSHLNMSGGGIHLLDLGNDATAFLSGGLIRQIWSSQVAWEWDYGVDPRAWVPNPHITIECSDHFYDTDTKLLTGHWLDSGAAFSIKLIDVDGSSPAIENIRFIPEPATLLLLGLGGLVLRKRIVR